MIYDAKLPPRQFVSTLLSSEPLRRKIMLLNEGEPLAGSRSSRSGRMIHCLRESLLYSEKRPRDMLFEVIEGALESKGADETPLTVCRLTRVMADRVRLSAARSGFDFSNWHIASRAVMNAMIHAGVLLTDDDVGDPAGVAAQAARILRVKRGYKGPHGSGSY